MRERVALRDGRVAVVYAEGLDDITVTEKASATDWDTVVRRKQAHYRFAEPANKVDDCDDGEFALSSVA